MLRRAPFAEHVLGSRGQDLDVQDDVAVLFRAAAESDPPVFAPHVVRRLLARAPDPELLGVQDWQRGLRADEVAVIFGSVPPTRRQWLLRADEIARAWGRALLGPEGIVQTVLGPDAPPNLPH
uniref:hypothetical protein n=1 Tax=Actinokineospora sp. CA-119265 TaxID=3239890 RepID=UPI003F492685